jgi:hypothetical protein
MVIKYITKGGSRIHEPPYTKDEEREFYQRVGRGPVTVGPGVRKARTSPTPPRQSPANVRKKGDT